MEPFNEALLKSRDELEKIYNDKHLQWLKDGYSEKSWLEMYPKEFDSWNNGERGHFHLTNVGMQKFINKVDEAITKINEIEERVAELEKAQALRVEDEADSLLKKLKDKE